MIAANEAVIKMLKILSGVYRYRFTRFIAGQPAIVAVFVIQHDLNIGRNTDDENVQGFTGVAVRYFHLKVQQIPGLNTGFLAKFPERGFAGKLTRPGCPRNRPPLPDVKAAGTFEEQNATISG